MLLGTAVSLSASHPAHQHHNPSIRFAENRLIDSNRAASDVMLQGDRFRMLGRSAVCTLTDKPDDEYERGLIGHRRLETHASDFSQSFDLSDKTSMVPDLAEALEEPEAAPRRLTLTRGSRALSVW